MDARSNEASVGVMENDADIYDVLVASLLEKECDTRLDGREKQTRDILWSLDSGFAHEKLRSSQLRREAKQVFFQRLEILTADPSSENLRFARHAYSMWQRLEIESSDSLSQDSQDDYETEKASRPRRQNNHGIHGIQTEKLANIAALHSRNGHETSRYRLSRKERRSKTAMRAEIVHITRLRAKAERQSLEDAWDRGEILGEDVDAILNDWKKSPRLLSKKAVYQGAGDNEMRRVKTAQAKEEDDKKKKGKKGRSNNNRIPSGSGGKR